MFISRINVSPVNFGIFVMGPKDGRDNSDIKKTKGDEFVKSPVILSMRTLPNFEDDIYDNIDGKNLWIDDTKKFLRSHTSQSSNVADSLVHMIYSNSFMKDLKRAKKNEEDEAVYNFFKKASDLISLLYMKKLPEEDLGDIEDGLDILQYSYENDALVELDAKKDHSVFLDDFISLGKSDLSEDKRAKIEENLSDYFDESFLVAPNPVLKIEMQVNDDVDDKTYIDAFKRFLTMSREASKKYESEDN